MDKVIKKVERYNHYLRHPGGLLKFCIKIVFLLIFLCFILSACNPESTVSENGQSINEETIIEENNSIEANEGSGLISNMGDANDDIVQENTDDSISDDNSNGGEEDSSQGTVNGNSGSQSDDGSIDTENINTENSQQDTVEALMEKPSVKLSIIEGPQYAQDGSICYYRVKAEVTGNPAPVITFSKDDSNGSWGSNVTQINLAQNETYNIICEAKNSEGVSTTSISLKWITPENTGTGSQEASIDYSNPGSFRIDVNLTTQVVSVHYNENLIRSMKCSGGTADNPTVTGTFSTYEKIYRAWISKFNQGAYYWVRFYGPYLFHSVPFDQNWNMIAEEAIKIGTPASHGCIRMALEDAKWFYETLPLGIKVDIHY